MRRLTLGLAVFSTSLVLGATACGDDEAAAPGGIGSSGAGGTNNQGGAAGTAAGASGKGGASGTAGSTAQAGSSGAGGSGAGTGGASGTGGSSGAGAGGSGSAGKSGAAGTSAGSAGSAGAAAGSAGAQAAGAAGSNAAGAAGTNGTAGAAGTTGGAAGSSGNGAGGDAGANGAGAAGAAGAAGNGQAGGAGAAGSAGAPAALTTKCATPLFFEDIAAMAMDKAGNVIVTSRFKAEFTVNGVSYKPAGGNDLKDIYVAKLDGSTCEPIWIRTFGGPANGDAPFSVAAEGNGDVLLLGIAEGDVDVGVPTKVSRLFVARLAAADGKTLAAKDLDPMNAGQPSPRIAASPTGDVVIAGGLEGELHAGGSALQGDESTFLIILQNDFTHTFSTVFTSGKTRNGSLAVSHDGDIAIGGVVQGSIDFGNGKTVTPTGGQGAFLAKLDKTGKAIWAKGSTKGVAHDLAFDSQGNLAAAGFEGGVSSLTPAGDVAWTKPFDTQTGDKVALRVGVGPADQVLVTGAFSKATDFGGGTVDGHPTEADLFLVEYSATGAYLGGLAIGTAAADESGWGVAMDSAGSIALLGRVAKANPAPLNAFFLAKFNP